MPRMTADTLAKQKAARQKKLLFALAPVLLLLLVWQGPGMLKLFSGDASAPEAVPESTEPAPATPAPDPATGVPPTTAAAGAPVAAEAQPPAELPETDVPMAAGAGQLVSFDRFVGKDPFKQLVVEQQDLPPVDPSGGSSDPNAAGGTGGSSGSGSSTGNPTVGVPGVPPSAPPSAPPGADGGGGDAAADDGKRTSARVDVSGTREQLFAASTFPSTDPIFRIVSIAPKSAKIALVTGRFSNGRATLTLRVRKPLTLVSQTDGLRYVVTLLATGKKTA